MKTSVAVPAVLCALAIGAGHVGADEIFFPYLVRSPTTTSIVSVVNLERATSPGRARTLRYTYIHKSGAAAPDDASPCDKIEFARSTSPNDVQTFDVGSRFAQSNFGVMFNDPSINNNYLGAGQSFSGLIGAEPPGEPAQSRAFLLVDNNDGQSDTGALYGETWILDFAGGSVWSYRAYNALVDEALRADGQLGPDESAASNSFSNQFETEGEVLNGADPAAGMTPVHLLPDDEFVVRFYVTPVADTTDDNGDGRLTRDELGSQRQCDLTTSIRLFIDSDQLGGGVAYDRDENPITGPLVQEVKCVGAIDARDELLTQGVLNQLKQAGSDGGGWSNLQTLSPAQGAINPTAEAVVFRYDFNRSDTLDGLPVVSPGERFGDAVWLRNGTDRNLAYESLVPNPMYDVSEPAGVVNWGGDSMDKVKDKHKNKDEDGDGANGIPSPYGDESS